MRYLDYLRPRGRLATASIAVVIAGGGLGATGGGFAVAHAANAASGHVTYLGQSTPSGGSSSGSASSASDATAPSADHALSPTNPAKSALSNPSPPGSHVSSSPDGSVGFSGLNHFDERNAGTGKKYAGTQFSLEPPDQGLCVGNGFVLESVNDAFAVYRPSGTSLTGPIALNQFYQRSPAIIRKIPASSSIRGDFLSDPKCYYDDATGRWFQSILEVDAPGFIDGKNRTHVLLAVSTTGDPTGTWNLFSLDTSNDGKDQTPLHTGCPCLPDQPLIGANADGFFISTNEFQLTNPANPFNGAQLYAFSKTALESPGTPAFVHFDTGTIPTGDAALPFWGSIQPAASPTGPSQSSNAEFLLSTAPMDINQNNAALDYRIVVWALTGTASLNNASPNVNLVFKVLQSEVYGPGVNLSAGGTFSATQKDGATPFRDTFGPGQPLERLNANDSRMNQVVYANGALFSAVNTVVSGHGEPDRVGIAYFVIQPQLDNGQNGGNGGNGGNNDNGGVGGTIVTQDYVAAKGANVLFPSIGVTADGVGAMAFTVTGPDNFPSAAFVRFDGHGHGIHGQIHLSAAGVGPDDGFTAYNTVAFGGNGIGRWGDYSAAVATPDGQVWMATEYIGQTCTTAQYQSDPTCGKTRTTNANWGTFISHVSAGH
jgi:hypothetical protein